MKVKRVGEEGIFCNYLGTCVSKESVAESGLNKFHRLSYSGIPYFFGKSQIEDMFSPFGSVLSIYLFRDEDTSIFTGSGYVTYRDSRSSNVACRALDNYMIGSYRLSVKINFLRIRDEDISLTTGNEMT